VYRQTLFLLQIRAFYSHLIALQNWLPWKKLFALKVHFHFYGLGFFPSNTYPFEAITQLFHWGKRYVLKSPKIINIHKYRHFTSPFHTMSLALLTCEGTCGAMSLCLRAFCLLHNISSTGILYNICFTIDNAFMN
jgi:hypothetical protein